MGQARSLVRLQKYLATRVVDRDHHRLPRGGGAAGDQSRRGALEQLTANPPDPLDMFEYAYAEMPRHLLDQREELQRELARRNERDAPSAPIRIWQHGRE